LELWASGIEDSISDLESQMLPLKHQLDEFKRELDLVNQLIQLKLRPADTDVETTASHQPPFTTSQNGANQRSLEEHVQRILDTNGTPMHVSKILQSLKEDRIPIPGRGEEANVILRMRRDPDRFVRTNRGTYGLRIWGVKEMPVRRRAKRRGKRS
jgi:exonuclease VII small subunit